MDGLGLLRTPTSYSDDMINHSPFCIENENFSPLLLVDRLRGASSMVDGVPKISRIEKGVNLKKISTSNEIKKFCLFSLVICSPSVVYCFVTSIICKI